MKYEDERLQGEKRDARMSEAASRIAQTESGMRFLDRIYEISKPKPRRSEPEPEGE